MSEDISRKSLQRRFEQRLNLSVAHRNEEVAKMCEEITILPDLENPVSSNKEVTPAYKGKRRRSDVYELADIALHNVVNRSVALMVDGPKETVLSDLIATLNEVTKVLGLVMEAFKDETKTGNGTAAVTTKVQGTVAKKNLPFKPFTKKQQQKSAPQPMNTIKLVNKQPSTAPEKPTATTTKTLPTKTQAPKTWSSMVKANLLGSRKDTVVTVEAEKSCAIMEEVPLRSEKEIKQFTREPREAINHEITVLRYSKMPCRKSVSAKMWRAKLKENEIRVHSVLFPAWGVIELIADKKDEVKIRRFFKSLNREPEENASPFAPRKAGETTINQDSLDFLVRNRLQMMKYEGSLVSLRYLTQCVKSGMALLDNPRAEKIDKELQQVMKKLKL